MAMMMQCDSCGADISPGSRVQMIYPSGVDAGYNIDLCMKCADPILKNDSVKKAAVTFKDRMAKAAQATAVKA